ncbi:hypothetical protein BH24BAC1_BH24BAC1_40920 [soil metagenome]
MNQNLNQDNPVNWVGEDKIEVQRQFNQGYVSNSYAEYKIDDFKDHFILGMVGFNQEYQYNTRVNGSSTTLISPNLIDIGATTGIQQITGGKTQAGLRGGFYRFNYNFKERYFLESNGRYDGTSRFPKKDRFGFFPSFGVGWRISEEPFMAGTRNVIDNLKVRATYGSLGNQLLGNNFYPYIPSMPSGFSDYVMNTGMIPTVRMPGLVSPTLTWEEVVSQNVGIDVILLNNRLETSFEVYTRDTRKMLMRRTYPSILGTGAPQENAADLRTTGWEFILKWRDNVGRDLNYWLDFNLSDWTSKITKFENPTGARTFTRSGPDSTGSKTTPASRDTADLNWSAPLTLALRIMIAPPFRNLSSTGTRERPGFSGAGSMPTKYRNSAMFNGSTNRSTLIRKSFTAPGTSGIS